MTEQTIEYKTGEELLKAIKDLSPKASFIAHFNYESDNFKLVIKEKTND